MLTVADRSLWQEVLGALERRVGAGAVDLWLRDAALVDATREEVVLAVATEFARRRIEGQLAPALAVAFESLLGARPMIRVEVDPTVAIERDGAAPAGAADAPAERGRAILASGRPAERMARLAALNADMRLDTLVMGASNRVVLRAADRVCESPGGEFNPLVVVGASGLGKTHVLTGIARRLGEGGAGLDVLLATAEDFANQFFVGIRTSQTEAFRERYRRADAVLIDDIHLLSTKKNTQVEFLHTFEELLNAQKQIIVSSEVNPKRLDKMHAGLSGRLLAGLVVELEPPDLETRRRIVDVLAKRHRIALPREVQEFVARNITRTVRDLVGALKRLQALAAIGEKIDVPLAKRRLEDLLGPRNTVPLEELILQIVAERCGAPIDELRAGGRRQSLARARQIAMFLVRRLTKLSLTEIGRFFGREPSTVTFAEGKVARLLVQDDGFNRLVEECQEKFEDRR